MFFRTTKKLEATVDDYLDAVSQGMLVFSEGIKDYLAGNAESFCGRIEAIRELENAADQLRRSIETSLYSHSLIPEHRGDVLGLLERVDDVIDRAKKTLKQFHVESPDIPEEIHPDFVELTRVAVLGAEAAVTATRAYFKNLSAVKDHLHKVYFYEKEADRVGDLLKGKIFQSEDLDLARKGHLRTFVVNIDRIADEAQGVADRLAISVIKRTL